MSILPSNGYFSNSVVDCGSDFELAMDPETAKHLYSLWHDFSVLDENVFGDRNQAHTESQIMFTCTI